MESGSEKSNESCWEEELIVSGRRKPEKMEKYVFHLILTSSNTHNLLSMSIHDSNIQVFWQIKNCFR